MRLIFYDRATVDREPPGRESTRQAKAIETLVKPMYWVIPDPVLELDQPAGWRQ